MRGTRGLFPHFFAKSRRGTILRERYVDDFAARATSLRCSQVLSFGAGFDTRFFRIFDRQDHPVRTVEIDLSETIAEKRRCIVRQLGTMPQDLLLIAMDLTNARLESLVDQGYQPGEPTLYLLQGLTYYLPEPVFDTLMAFIFQNAADGSQIIYDNCHPEMTFKNDVVPGISGSIDRLNEIGEPYLFAEQPPQAIARLTRNGWSSVKCQEATDLELLFRHRKTLPEKIWYVIHGQLTPKQHVPD